GTGTIAALAIVKALSGSEIQNSLRVIGFDQEELGLVGSRAYVRQLKDKKNIIGDIQLEMMGTNSKKDGAFHIIDCDKSNSKFLTQAVLQGVADLSLSLKP